MPRMPSIPDHTHLVAALDAMEPGRFQWLCNDLLAAEHGVAWKPRNLRFGRNDGGFDASFEGVLGGTRREWRVSIKHVAVGEGDAAVKALRGHLSTEFQRAENLRWPCLVVTNVRLTEAEERIVVEEVRSRCPDGHVFDGSRLTALAAGFPFLMAQYGLSTGDGRLVFRSAHALEDDYPDQPPFSLDAWRKAGEEIRVGMEAGAGLILLVGFVGSGRERILREVAHRWLQPETPPSRWFPVWLVPEQAGSLDRALADELSAAHGRYLFLVPRITDPSTSGERVLRMLAGLRVPDRSASHAVVMACSPLHKRAMEVAWVGSASNQETQIVELWPPSDDEVESWLGSTCPAYLKRRLAVAAVRRPMLAWSVVRRDRDGMADRVWSEVRGLQAGGSRDVSAEILLASLVSMPFTAGGSEVDQITAWTGADRPSVVRLLDRAVQAQLVGREGDTYRVEGDLLASVVVDACVAEDSTCVARVADRIIGTITGDGAAEEAGRRLLRLAELSGDGSFVPAWMDRQLPRLDVADAFETERLLEVFSSLAPTSPEAADRVLRAVRAVLARRRDGPLPVPEVFSAHVSDDGFERVLGNRLAYAVGSVRLHAQHTQLAFRMLVEVIRQLDVSVDMYGLDPVTKTARALVHPGLPDPFRRFDLAMELLEPLVTGLPATGGRRAGDLAGMAGAVAGMWLALGIPFRYEDRRGITLGTRAWPEADSRLPAARRRALGLLFALVDSPLPEVRRQGWSHLLEVAGSNWSGPGLPLSDDLRAVLCEVLEAVAERVPALTAWEDRVYAEDLVVRWGWLEERDPALPRAAAIRIIRSFHAEPEYLAWRVLTHDMAPGQGPEAWARSWEAGKDRPEPVPGPPQETCRDLVQRLVRSVTRPEQVLALLQRVPGEVTWAGQVLLQTWIEADPSVFRPLVLGTLWSQVPGRIRGYLLHASRTRFQDEIRALLDGPLLVGAMLGVAAEVQEVLDHPDEADPHDAMRVLGPLLRGFLPPRLVAPTLFALAGHPSADVRRFVATALLTRVGPEPVHPRLAPADVAAIVRRLGDDPAGVFAVREISSMEARLVADDDPDIQSALEEVVLATLETGRWPPGEPDRGPAEVVARVIARDLERWARSVHRAMLGHPRKDTWHIPEPEILGAAGANLSPGCVVQALQRLLPLQAAAESHAQRVWLGVVVKHLASHLRVDDVCTLIPPMLATGGTELASRILAEFPPLAAERYLRVLATTLAVLDTADARALADVVARAAGSNMAFAGALRAAAQGGADAATHLGRIADAVEQVAAVYDRIAEHQEQG